MQVVMSGAAGFDVHKRRWLRAPSCLGGWTTGQETRTFDTLTDIWKRWRAGCRPLGSRT